MGKYALAVLAGLLAAAAALFVASLMAGGGHGWSAPFLFSLTLFAIYPAVAVQTVRTGTALWPDLVLAAAAIAGDVLLFRNVFGDELEYFERAGGLAYLWLPFWFVWQAVLAGTVLATLRRRDEACGRGW